MKTKTFLFGAALFVTACSTPSGNGWQSSDLKSVPLFVEDLGEGQYTTYVNTQTGEGQNSFCSGTLFYDGRAIVNDADGYYFVDSDLKESFSARYADVTIYHDGIAWAVTKGGPLTAVDKNGNMLFELKQAEMAAAFHDGVAAFANAEGRWGLVDKKGTVLVEPQWEDVVPMFVNGLIAVKSPVLHLWGLANKKGEEVVSCTYQELGTKDYDEGFQWNYVQALNEGRIPVQDQNDKWGVIDKKGNFIINPQFNKIQLDGKNYLFRKGRLYGWCDKEGHYLINPQFADAHPFCGDELAAVKDKEEGWGYIDLQGKWVIEAQFREAGRFLSSGIAPVKDDGSREWGAIDKTGKYVVNPQFKAMYDYGAADRLLVVDQSRCMGVIDNAGKYVVTPVYKDASMELLRNVSGVGAKYKAVSDFVDVEGLAALIDAEIHTLKSTTTGGLLAAYGLSESKFSKGGGETTIYKKNITPELTFKLVVAGIDAWSKTSDGWFGYNYSFRSDVPVTGYIFTVDFNGKGKAWRFVEEIAAVLKKKYTYHEDTGTLDVPGYASVLILAIPNGGFVFHVKTE